MDRLHAGVVEAFRQGWPDDDARVVEPATLRIYIEDMDGQLQTVVERLKRRLDWAIDQMNRLDEVRRKQGTLDPEQDSLRNRCDRYVKRLKGNDPRKRRERRGL